MKSLTASILANGVINSLNYICQGLEETDLWPWIFQMQPLPPTMHGKPWPKISIITPSYNHGLYLEETIRSVLLQGYPNLEYIVVDGGSSDNTSMILKRYESEISVCISEPDNGQSHALNKGFGLATGDVLAWLNSDDLYLPNTLKEVALAFDSQDVDIVIGGCQVRNNFSRIPQLMSHHCILPMNQTTSLPYEKMLYLSSYLQGDFFYQPEVFWTKRLWDSIGRRVDEQLHLAMDYELWLRFAKANARVLHIPELLAIFRIHVGQKSILGADMSNYPEHLEVIRQYRLGLRP